MINLHGGYTAERFALPALGRADDEAVQPEKG